MLQSEIDGTLIEENPPAKVGFILSSDSKALSVSHQPRSRRQKTSVKRATVSVIPITMK